jgi:hypothetical protein
MPIESIEISVKSEADGPHIVQRISALSEASPFLLHDVEKVGTNSWNCIFVTARPDLVVGFRSVTELLSRLAFEFDVYRVERIVGPAKSIAS